MGAPGFPQKDYFFNCVSLSRRGSRQGSKKSLRTQLGSGSRFVQRKVFTARSLVRNGRCFRGCGYEWLLSFDTVGNMYVVHSVWFFFAGLLVFGDPPGSSGLTVPLCRLHPWHSRPEARAFRSLAELTPLRGHVAPKVHIDWYQFAVTDLFKEQCV